MTKKLYHKSYQTAPTCLVELNLNFCPSSWVFILEAMQTISEKLQQDLIAHLLCVF